MIALANHLWQSTLFAGLAGLLALVLRGNSARLRHWIWLAASIKFLVPFALLVAIGARLAPPSAAAAPPLRVSYAIEEVSRPFTAPASHLLPSARSSTVDPVAALLLAIWARGFAGIAFSWWTRWRRVRRLACAASPWRGAVRLPIPVWLSPEPIEPGVFGILRPVLLLPRGIAGRLPAAQLRAVVAHEMCHVRRRDNLAAAMHMLVEALFWFHPLVWWIGARLVDERERACDEEVLRQGNPPADYAAGILAACKLYVRSPLPCVSGVTGADLRGRIERIMTGAAAHRMNAAKKLLLGAAAIAAIAGPVAVGLGTAHRVLARPHEAGAPPQSFEVASVKPSPPNIRGYSMSATPGGRLVAKNIPLATLIGNAYEAHAFRFAGMPGWAATVRYDLEGKAADPNASKHDLARMLQSLLADRFHLTIHRETREMPRYSLVLGKGAPKLEPPEHPGGTHGVDFRGGGLQMLGRNATMEDLAQALSFRMNRSVIDKTGIPGNYDFKMEFSPDDFIAAFGEEKPASADPNGTSILTAIQEQLGLKLESGKGPVEILVIDRLEKPTAN